MSAIEVLRKHKKQIAKCCLIENYEEDGELTKALKEALLALEKQENHKCDNPDCKSCEVCGGRHNCWHTNRTMKDDVKEMVEKARREGFVQGQIAELKRLLEETSFSQNRAECGFCKTIEQVNAFIEWEEFEAILKKRLKEVEGRLKEQEVVDRTFKEVAQWKKEGKF